MTVGFCVCVVVVFVCVCVGGGVWGGCPVCRSVALRQIRYDWSAQADVSVVPVVVLR